MKKMKKQFEIAAVMVAIMVLSVLMVHPVMSGLGDENTTNVTKTNEDSMAKYFYLDTEGTKISTAITNKTNVSEREFLISMAVTSNLVGTIVFYSDRDGDYEIYVMNTDGTNVTKLTINTAYDTAPAWSPDGSKIAFSSDRDGDQEIYVMDADGTNVVRLTRNIGYDIHPAWSPDGSKIAFSSGKDGDQEIYVMDADGTNVVRLTRTADPIINQRPSWSPDGKRIAFMSDKDGDNEVYVMNVDGTHLTQLTINTADDVGPKWCQVWEIWVYDTNGNGVIEKSEAGNAAKDYFDDTITMEQALEVLLLHFATQP